SDSTAVILPLLQASVRHLSKQKEAAYEQENQAGADGSGRAAGTGFVQPLSRLDESAQRLVAMERNRGDARAAGGCSFPDRGHLASRTALKHDSRRNSQLFTRDGKTPHARSVRGGKERVMTTTILSDREIRSGIGGNRRHLIRAAVLALALSVGIVVVMS